MKQNILIIEDDKLVIGYYKELFKNLNAYQIHIADGIREAFLKVQKDRFFIIISDFVMPDFQEMAAPDLFKYIRTTPLNSKTPIFVVTANKDLAQKEIADDKIRVLTKDQSTGDKLVEFLEELSKSSKSSQPSKRFTENGKLKAEIIQKFKESTIKVFKTMANISLTYLDSCTDCKIQNVDISSTFGITSTNMRGALSLSLSQDIFFKTISHMFQTKVYQYSEDYDAAVAELVNIILGSTKRELKLLDDNNINVVMGVPVLIKGECHELSNLGGSYAKAVLPFEYQTSRIYLSISILEN